MLKIGDYAPDFQLVDQHNTDHSLKQYLGNWIILYFYPKDDTPGCTTEACSFRDTWDTVRSKAVLFGISTDSSTSHAKFTNKYHLPFPLLADINRSVVSAYKVWAPKKFMGREFLGTHRTTFIINPEGKIAKVYPNVKPVGHANQVISDLNLLQSVS